jgi:hypothetical protein
MFLASTITCPLGRNRDVIQVELTKWTRDGRAPHPLFKTRRRPRFAQNERSPPKRRVVSARILANARVGASCDAEYWLVAGSAHNQEIRAGEERRLGADQHLEASGYLRHGRGRPSSADHGATGPPAVRAPNIERYLCHCCHAGTTPRKGPRSGLPF